MANAVLLVELVVFALIVLVISIWWVLKNQTRRRQKQIERQSKQIQARLGSIERDIAEIEQEAKCYPPTDPEPYYTLAGDLHERLGSIRPQNLQQQKQFNTLSTKKPSEPEHLWAWLLFDFWRGPRFWRDHLSRFEVLLAAIEGLCSDINDTQTLLKTLHDLPLTVAQDVRALAQALEQSRQIGLDLGEAGVHGDTLNGAMTRVQNLQADLKKVPSNFLDGSDEVVLREAKQNVATAWQIVQELHLAIKALFESFKAWQSRHQLIERQVKAMRKGVADMTTGLKQIPASVNITEMMKVINETSETFKKREAVYPALTLDIFDGFAASVSEVSETAQQVLKEMGRIGQDYRFLARTIPVNADLLEQIQVKMVETEQVIEYPIDWESFTSHLQAYFRGHKDIGNLHVERTPAQLHEHAFQAENLNKNLEYLESQVDLACADRLALLPLLAHEDLIAKPAWFATAKTLDKQTNPYASANWSQPKSATKILKDAKDLSKRKKKWASSRPRDPLPVTQLHDQLVNLNKLSTDLAVFKVRLQEVEAEFVEFQRAEQTAAEQLETTHEALAGLIQQIQETQHPLDSGRVNYQQKLNDLHKQNRSLNATLKNRRTGQVMQKVGKVNLWLKSCRTELQALPWLFQAEIKAIEAELRHLVESWPDPTPFNHKEIRQALAAERPGQLPLPDQNLEHDLQWVMFYANQVEAQLQERENLGRLLEEVKARFEALRGEPPQLLTG